MRTNLGQAEDRKRTYEGPHRQKVQFYRNIYHRPERIQRMIYKSMVRPQLEYCSTIWESHNKCHINQLKAMQNRDARFIMNDLR